MSIDKFLRMPVMSKRLLLVKCRFKFSHITFPIEGTYATEKGKSRWTEVDQFGRQLVNFGDLSRLYHNATRGRSR